MFEIFFMFTVIFVAYVVYHMFNEQKEAPAPTSSAPKTQLDVSAVLAPKPAVVLAPKTANQSKKTAAVKPKVVKKTPAKATAKVTDTKKGLRDPKTGEVATSYNNYRFTKRWIKDALVSEGLLEKVYKNNELEPDIEATIKAAIVKLEALEKYKP
ncbi:MAG: hypothetical protein D0531_06805 [Methylococcales bacterium]|nr:MAG: hypothetical protein D0531_06805 [Methylococcales bacterium]